MTMDNSYRRVVTYQAPGSTNRITVCPSCEERLLKEGWPKDPRGVEYCEVYKGLTPGRCAVHPKGASGAD